MNSANVPKSDTYTGLRQGDGATQARVWDEHYPVLVRAAKRKLDGVPRRSFDEEDVALSAMHCFFDAVRAGTIYPWQSVGELCRLLLTITRRKAFAFRRRETREKRGGGKVRGDSVLYVPPEEGHGPLANRREPQDYRPSPKTACARAEDEKQLLDALPDDSLRQIARLRLNGHTNDEIAVMLGCARRTVERKVHLIRVTWARAQGVTNIAMRPSARG